MQLSDSLIYYKNPLICKALITYAQDKEIGAVFHGGYFGKRPDVLIYPNDVLELAKKKVSSLHCSEELWHNPLSIRTGMKRHELDELRLGWDLILDIDCPDWELSKLTAHLFVLALQHHGITYINAKFSGNKGFHIAVPFEAFPKTIAVGTTVSQVKNLFPEGPRAIASYLLSFIQRNYVKILPQEKKIVFADTNHFTFSHLEKIAKASGKSLFISVCSSCEHPTSFVAGLKKIYQCQQCGHISKPKGFPELIRCEKCSYPVYLSTLSNSCTSCQSQAPPIQKIDITSVVEVDTVLIASRHLYRMPFSLHEKSGLVSIPVVLNNILSFDKQSAKPENITKEITLIPFLLRNKKNIEGQATNLLREAFDNYQESLSKNKPLPVIEIPESAILSEFFPPCIQKLSTPLEDGKKRALFVLVNFLRSVGWSKDQITSYIYEWNDNHPEPLREQYLKGQLSQIKISKKILPPPSCSNTDYYKALQVCHPDSFCPRIKNPAQYAKNKSEVESTPKKKLQEKTSFISNEYFKNISLSFISSHFEKALKSFSPKIDILGSAKLFCFGQKNIDILIQAPFIEKISLYLLKNNFYLTQDYSEKQIFQGNISSSQIDKKVQNNSEDIICTIILAKENSQTVKDYLQTHNTLINNDKLLEEFISLKKKYIDKTLSSYIKAKNKFFMNLVK
jgi:hypothetical protein